MIDKTRNPTPETQAQAQELSLDQLEQAVAAGSTGGTLAAPSAGGALIGDADGDGDVDGRDFLLWRRSNG